MKKRYKIAAVIASVLIALFLLDYYIGYQQNRLLAEKAAQKKKIEQLAWYSLRGEVKEVSYSGHQYRIALKFENAFPEEEMYIMLPQVRCLVQVGTLWKEVPVHDPGDKSTDTGVIKLEGVKIIEKLIEVPFKNYEQVLPGYMHVRLNTVSYVSSNAVSKDDIVEKNEDFYIYLRPYDADLGNMSKKYTFTHNDIPIFIPMPPH
ncbi:MAG TPA: hypothetical protein VLG39_11435 [Nitrospirota bacterium]|nr:hypothetical protein [Nitrospirota bacterium]